MRGKSRFVSNSAALAASTAASTVFTLLQVKILAAFLDRDTFGLFVALRGLSLLVSMLAANGLPQLLIRYLPVHESRRDVHRAALLSAGCLAGSAVLTAALAVVLHALRASAMSSVPVASQTATFFIWFYATTLGVTLKLVLYGGLNGLRRLTVQTVLETGSLAVQVAWVFAWRGRLDLESLFTILGTVALGTVVVGVPWYARHLRVDTGGDGGADSAQIHYGQYWLGATGLALVAVAFTDVDRYVLSGVLALETLSLFHVGSKVVRLAFRFVGIPVLAFQPEVSRLDAEGRSGDVVASARVFLKFNVVVSVFGALALAVFADLLIRLVANASYLPARAFMVVLATSLPLAAMTSPLTAVMKALDQVRRAFYCDLAWAVSYLVLLVTLSHRHGLMGAAFAQVLACLVQLTLAALLSRFAVGGTIARAVPRALAASALALVVPAAADWLPGAEWLRITVRVLLFLPGLVVLRYAVLGLGIFSRDERDRLAAMLAAAGPTRYLGRLLS